SFKAIPCFFRLFCLLVLGVLASGQAWADLSGSSSPGAAINSAQDFMTHFPRIGRSQAKFHDADPPVKTLFYLGANAQGVIRQFFFTGAKRGSEFINFSDWNDLSLRIYVDQGNVSDFAAISTASLAAEIPLGILFGKDFVGNGTSNH